MPCADIRLFRNGAVSGQVWLTIEAENAGNPSGTPLATSDKIDASLLNTTPIWVRFMFRSPATLALSTQYHLVLQGDYTRSDTVYVSWNGLVAGGYANGVSKDYNGAIWSATPGANGLDRLFAIYTERNNSPLVLPAGYEQFCKLGYVYNGSGNDFMAFMAKDRIVQLPVQAFAVTGGTAIIPTLVDISAFVPPGQVALYPLCGSTLVGLQIVMIGVPDGYAGLPAIRSIGVVPVNNGYTGMDRPPLTEAQGFYYFLSGATPSDIRVDAYEW